jgi:hypothetical protein
VTFADARLSVEEEYRLTYARVVDLWDKVIDDASTVRHVQLIFDLLSVRLPAVVPARTVVKPCCQVDGVSAVHSKMLQSESRRLWRSAMVAPPCTLPCPGEN